MMSCCDKWNVSLWMSVFLLTSISRAVHVNLFTMQKDSEHLRDWVLYHGDIFGFEYLTVIDTNSTGVVKEQLKEFMKMGVRVSFQVRNRGYGTAHVIVITVRVSLSSSAQHCFPRQTETYDCCHDSPHPQLHR